MAIGKRARLTHGNVQSMGSNKSKSKTLNGTHRRIGLGSHSHGLRNAKTHTKL